MLDILSFVFLILIGTMFFLGIQYNSLQRKAHLVKEAHSNILVAMKKRLDLINKLIDIASAYGSHEKLTYITISKEANITEIMTSYQKADKILGQLNNIMRNFPELKANETYQMLMKQLENVENDLQKKREEYNAVAREYNTTRNSIPTVFIAHTLGFKEAPYFSIEIDAVEALKEFRTDDGEMLKALIKTTSSKVLEAAEKASAKVEKALESVSQREKQET
ncbi:LemA family protein [Thermosulfurimonas dismutans]|nr:LemA family protein [Thermosulfurimonas dismutans]